MKRSLPSVLFALVCALLLSACAGMRVVDNDVVSFAQWPNAAPPAPGPSSRYRFERLPSQQSGLPQSGISGMALTQDQIETIARTALDKFGWQNMPAAATFNVQVSATTRYAQRNPYNSPAYGGFGGFGNSGVSIGGGTAGSFIGFSFPLGRSEPSLYLREVSIVVRDAASNAVTFESRATHSGIWNDPQKVLPAMFEAALQGFPTPPAGARRINIEISR
jgi:predicted small secreted protein